MARSKTIPDDQVLDTLFETLLETGPAGLTFARAAKSCGLSPATLVQRYGNRDALVLAILLRAWDQLDTKTSTADMQEPLTPDGAIALLMRLMPPETAERDTTDGLLLLREDIRNPILRERGAAWGHRLAEILGRRLSDNQVEGKQLGWQMASIWQGAHTWWAFTRDQSADHAIRTALREWVTRVIK
ncbi:TetR/AcrR family transcriptional regulator [Thalassospira xiamenensis]|uniref:Transcriptional regulator, TetR family n=1 Tax=Thalassospira xiamenensis TaxID=220697 RepID=A0A285RHY9_9PROT|nr:TetR family transcriptional regulator [Thalassospira xiamenensis]SOB93309.1 transcriptional regulator, TetR family [Thalassospira xiamenensis]